MIFPDEAPFGITLTLSGLTATQPAIYLMRIEIKV